MAEKGDNLEAVLNESVDLVRSLPLCSCSGFDSGVFGGFLLGGFGFDGVLGLCCLLFVFLICFFLGGGFGGFWVGVSVGEWWQ